MKKWRIILAILLCNLLIACRATNNDAAETTGKTAPTAIPTTVEASPAATITVSVATRAKATSSPESSRPPEPEDRVTETPHLEQQNFAQFPGAGSIDFTVAGEGHIYVAYGQANNVYVSQSDNGGETFGEAVVASQEGNVFVYPLERPAIAVGPTGRIHVAWPEDNYPGHIWYAVSDDGGQTFGPSLQLSGEGPETVLVRLLLEPGGSPLAVWLQNSELRFTHTGDDGESFLPDRVIDDQTCDCCHPQPLWLNGELLIAYRNLVFDDSGQQIRDIYLIKSSDGGGTFDEPVRVSDAPWYIDVCPFSGPSLVSDGKQTLFASWMDGRNDVAGDFSQTDIWLAISADGGQTFSTNRRINQATGAYNNLPSLAREETGRLHVIWQAEEAERDVLYYAVSTDDGQTFAPPQVLVDSTGNRRRRPTNASLLVDQMGVVYTSWVDGEGGYLATWQFTKDGSG